VALDRCATGAITAACLGILLTCGILKQDATFLPYTRYRRPSQGVCPTRGGQLASNKQTSLKDANRTPLLIAALANAVAFAVLLKGDALVGGHWLEAVRGLLAVLPAGAVAIVVGLLNSQLDDVTKARLVFWRWRDPLPGSRAFSKLAAADPRVDLQTLKKKHGPLPGAPAEQNRLWYRLYKTVANDASVVQVHRQFLFFRDFAGMVALLALSLGAAGFLFMPLKAAALYLLFLVIEFLMATRAARVHGTRFVTTVLALKGAGK
jgi:hypothetical protein